MVAKNPFLLFIVARLKAQGAGRQGVGIGMSARNTAHSVPDKLKSFKKLISYPGLCLKEIHTEKASFYR